MLSDQISSARKKYPFLDEAIKNGCDFTNCETKTDLSNNLKKFIAPAILKSLKDEGIKSQAIKMKRPRDYNTLIAENHIYVTLSDKYSIHIRYCEMFLIFDLVDLSANESVSLINREVFHNVFTQNQLKITLKKYLKLSQSNEKTLYKRCEDSKTNAIGSVQARMGTDIIQGEKDLYVPQSFSYISNQSLGLRLFKTSQDYSNLLNYNVNNDFHLTSDLKSTDQSKNNIFIEIPVDSQINKKLDSYKSEFKKIIKSMVKCGYLIDLKKKVVSNNKKYKLFEATEKLIKIADWNWTL